MNPKIIKNEGLLLAGFSFYGNPFAENDPWSAENEIGKLWARFMAYMRRNNVEVERINANPDHIYELHVVHPDTAEKSEYEVFIGVAVNQVRDLPLELVVKALPPVLYAVFTLQGAEINSDWHQMIYQEWMPQAGYAEAYGYGFQCYDQRFKGLDNLQDSILDVYIPVKQG